MKIVIYGNGAMARVLFSYARRSMDVCGFTVDDSCIAENSDTFCGMSLVPFSKVQEVFDPNVYKLIVAMGFINMNDLREKKYLEAKKKGYLFTSYVHESVLIHDDVSIDENCIILDHVSIHPGCKIGQDTFDYLKNFGFKNEVEVVMPGTNAKMNEMQALMGSLVLKHIDEIIEKRSQITTIYREKLEGVPGIYLRPELPKDVFYNYAYIAVEVDNKEFGMSRNQFYEKLKEYNIYSRRYFYPLICDFACYKSVAVKNPLTVARKVGERILTLPIYYDLALDDVQRICDIIIEMRG